MSKKEAILSEGVNLLSRTGFASVTLGVLAQRSGMSKSGLFAHFGSKEQVQLRLLEEAARVGAASFLEPALRIAPGMKRLRAVMHGWLGWTEKAGLEGGCPIAAGLFEFDDAPMNNPVRQRISEMEQQWRAFLLITTREAIDSRELRDDLDQEQFVWDLCGIYLNHHVSSRFLRDPNAVVRAQTALESLVERSSSANKPRAGVKQ